MIEVICYCDNTDDLIAEIAVKFPERLTASNKYLITKTPPKYNGMKSVSLVLCRSNQELTDLNSIDALDVLGTYTQMLADPAALAKYDSVYDRTATNVNYSGIDITFIPPDKIGAFL